MHFRDGLSSVGWNLLFNPHTKFEVSTITRNKEMKGNAKCRNSRFEPPFGGFRGNAQSVVGFCSITAGLVAVLLQSRPSTYMHEICRL